MRNTLEQQVKVVFSNIQGEELLDTLREMFVERPSYLRGNVPEETAFREGERSVVQMITDLNKPTGGKDG